MIPSLWTALSEKDIAHEYLFPMWELMNIFGKETFLGAEQCFVDNKLTIVSELNKEAKK